jgi:hypothetical protein
LIHGCPRLEVYFQRQLHLSRRVDSIARSLAQNAECLRLQRQGSAVAFAVTALVPFPIAPKGVSVKMRDLHGPLQEVEKVYHQIPFRTRLNTAQYGSIRLNTVSIRESHQTGLLSIPVAAIANG